MAAIVKPIEAKSIHQIQSGQVIVDLCSVVKELVENSLDAGANTVEVRFKNNGLDEIEVQDNGSGIAAVNYETVALKHYTSKLFTYDDLSNLQTFGFRGEALSSLCALSTFTITTAQADEAPKGHRLDFEISGKLKNTTIVACQRGTVATVQNLFEKLPVRRKELSKNIKREYGKVLGLLHAYACISTNVKFSVKNAVTKGKSMTVFATKSNATTRENIANVYGAKTLAGLVALELAFDLPSTSTQTTSEDRSLVKVMVNGHISKPIFGEGRQTPDRQMFFVNGRPCGLPQIAKAINEVYKSFNVSQSPFIFADLQLDTNAYDVNVSPDKRTIFLHNAMVLTEQLKITLTDLFERQNQTVPQSQFQMPKTPATTRATILKQLSTDSRESEGIDFDDGPRENDVASGNWNETNRLLHDHFRNLASTREDAPEAVSEKDKERLDRYRERRASKIVERLTKQVEALDDSNERCDTQQADNDSDHMARPIEVSDNVNLQVRDFNARMAEHQNRKHPRDDDEMGGSGDLEQQPVSSPSEKVCNDTGLVQNMFNRARPKRLQPELATITIGDRTVTRLIATHPTSTLGKTSINNGSTHPRNSEVANKGIFAQGLQKFNAPGTQTIDRVELERVEDDGSTGLRLPSAQHRLTSMIPFEIDNRRLESSEGGSDADFLTLDGEVSESLKGGHDHAVEEEEKIAEKQRVAELIRQAEEAAQRSVKGERRATQALKSTRVKDSVVSLALEVDIDIEEVAKLAEKHYKEIGATRDVAKSYQIDNETVVNTAEERLSLTVSKTDFISMHIVGQFNLGFILAVRQKRQTTRDVRHENDELFIIDQHASDEKYNFERLQAETVVSNQRMVRPVVLDLTAVEEEIVLDSQAALEKNGFVVNIDTSGEHEVGKRCRLVSLPLSKEVVFGTSDLDELIHLLAESPMLSESSPVPRPSKVRKMFAMRACRSSIMIGRTLSKKQMSIVLQHMGSIDKPWNCPHGRPTMRHLASLDALDDLLWKEGDGVSSGDDHTSPGLESASEIWKTYIQ